MTWLRIFKPDPQPMPVILQDVPPETLSDEAHQNAQNSARIGYRNEKKTNTLDRLSNEINDLAEQFLKQFKEEDR